MEINLQGIEGLLSLSSSNSTTINISLKEPPTYDENQMQLVALCFSYIRKDKTKTAKFHAQKIINCMETNFDVSLTHAQNALNALNINLKGDKLCCSE